MSFIKPTYQSQVYQSFREIQPKAYRVIVRFFEEHQKSIERLEFEEYLELLFSYGNALFELGAYTKYLAVADGILEQSISNNIQFIHGKDIFCETLFQKGASHYNLMEYDKADHLIRELIKIEPTNEVAIKLLKRIDRKLKAKFTKNIHAFSVGFFMASAIVICIELLIIQTFYNQWQDAFEIIRIILFALGIAIVALGEIYLKLFSEYKINAFVKDIKKKKGY